MFYQIFLFTTSKTMHVCYLNKCYIKVASWVAERLKIKDPRKLGKIRNKESVQTPENDSPIPKWKLCFCYH